MIYKLTKIKEMRIMMSQKYEALNKYTKMRNHLTRPMPVLDTGLLAWADKVQFGTDLEQCRDDIIRRAVEEAEAHWNDGDYSDTKPMFIRACPLQPRPGVLESSPAYDIEDVQEIVHRIVSTMLSKDTSDSPMYEHGYVDPNGCVITQPFIQADASAVLYPNSHIVFGEGHDGITAGQDCFKMIMKVSTNDHATNQDLAYLEIDPTMIELEFVSTMRRNNAVKNNARARLNMVKSTHLVQLRGSHGAPPIAPAPTMPSTFNGKLYGGNLFGCDDGAIYVEQIIHVKNADDSELAWLEEQLREHAGKQGLVVSHPLGSDGTHHCGQCVKYGVPYIKGEVKEFETYVQVVSGWVCDDPTIEPQPYDIMEHADAFMEGVEVGLYQFARQYGWLSNQFHQFMDGQMLHDPDQTAYLAGVFAGYMIAAPYSVALGECRHYGQKNNKTPIYLSTLHALYPNMYHNADASMLMETIPTDRRAFYNTVESVPLTLPSYIGALKWLVKVYSTGWSGGYGGAKYCDAVKKTLAVAEALEVMIEEPNNDNMMALCGVVNDCENIVHNNGFFLNKFLNKFAFDIGTDVDQTKLYLLNESGSQTTNIFNVFYAGLEANKLRRTEIPPLHDNTEVSSYAIKRMKMKPSTLAKNPMFLDKDIPEAYLSIPFENKFHAGEFGDASTSKFIPCGHTDCATCTKHLQDQLFTNAEVTPPIPNKNMDMVLPNTPIPTITIEVNGAIDLLFSTDVDQVYKMKTQAKEQIYDEDAMKFAVIFLKNNELYNADTLAKMNKYYSSWMATISQVDMMKFIEMMTAYDNKSGVWSSE